MSDQPPDPETGELVASVQKISLTDPKNQEGASYKNEVVLKVDKPYYWRVRAAGPDGKKGLWSPSNTFKTIKPKVELLAKSGGLMSNPWSIPLNWQFVKGAEAYKIYVSTDSQLSESEAVEIGSAGLKTWDVNQGGANPMSYAQYETAVSQNDGFHHWAVVAKGPGPHHEWGELSSVDTFKADYAKTKPVLVYPLSPPTSVGYKSSPVTFTWKRVAFAGQYKFAVFQRTGGVCGGLVAETLVPDLGAPNDASLVAHSSNVPGLSGGPGDVNGKCWRVTAVGPKNLEGLPSDGQYDVGPDQPILIVPADGATGVDYNPATVQWTTEWAPGGHEICFMNVATGVKDPCFTLAGGAVVQSLQPTLQPETAYQIHLTAYGPNNTWAAAKVAVTFTTKKSPEEEKKDECAFPGTPEITYPPMPPGDFYSTPPVGANVTFQWVPVSGAESYEYEIRTYHPLLLDYHLLLKDSGTAYGPSLGPVSHTPWKPFQGFVVKVRAKNACGDLGDWGTRVYIVNQ